MKNNLFKPKRISLCIATACLVAVVPTTQAYAEILTHTDSHTFSINDVQGGFDGSLVASDPTIVCGAPIPGSPACPADGPQPITDRDGDQLYPTDTEFGYYIVDFLGAQQKERDNLYMEGYVGNLEEAGVQVGVKISNAATEKYKVKPPLGTWCQGLGGTSVKCETEHYVVMEHVLSCHETVPYFFADPETGTQAILSTPDGSLTYDCANGTLDDNALVLVNGIPGDRLVNPTPCEAPNDPVGCQMFPNDKTDMLNNIALSTDYSVQLKDDGKPLYGWGGLHKRPNDVRMYASFELPGEWKDPGADFTITRAELIVDHWITNNPNDQLRPEDLENEAATGRKPSYRIEGTPGTADEVWKSTIACYEGDGDLIDTEEGSNDPTFLGIGTVLKNAPFALDTAAVPGTAQDDPPFAFSSDLYGGFTNAFYTTINRDPFEWSYDSDPDPLVQEFVGSSVPDDTLGTLVSGPRWRLKPNKFGQDLPGLEIPLVECSAPPFANDNIKYAVGDRVTTVINLLDWNDDEGPSPLATSKGWVDVTANEFVTVAGTDPDTGLPFTTNGLPMSDNFDLAVYVKGDRKPTAIYSAQLVVEYDNAGTVGDVIIDFEEIAAGQYPAVTSMGYAFSPVWNNNVLIRDDGNMALQPRWNDWLDMRREDGTDFNLASFDFRPQWSGVSGTVEIYGYMSDGTVLNDSFTYDDTTSATKVLNWTGLESVEFRMDKTVLFDNFVVSQDDGITPL